jgi:hypothetical protein
MVPALDEGYSAGDGPVDGNDTMKHSSAGLGKAADVQGEE